MLKKLYKEVQGIVYKCRNEYYLHLWELSDWDQEGMICLHELISREEELVEDIPHLRILTPSEMTLSMSQKVLELRGVPSRASTRVCSYCF